ncbi:MAG: hypothetical protein LBM59_00885 [Ruminococcus sp.]|jgi:hypothetical protein|nr:hypothetical protein [Ruminococcus sp.]
MNNFFNNLPRFRITAIIFALIGVVLIITGVIENAAQTAPRESLYALTDTELKPREYLSCTVDFVLENYAETTEESSTFGIKTDERLYSQHYIIPCYTADETVYFISAEVTYAPFEEHFNRILELSYSEDESVFRSEYFDFTGRVKTLDPELLEYAFETMQTYGYVADRTEFNEVFIPYEILVLAPDAYNVSVMILIGVAAIVIGVGLFLADMAISRKKAAMALQAAEQAYDTPQE